MRIRRTAGHPNRYSNEAMDRLDRPQCLTAAQAGGGCREKGRTPIFRNGLAFVRLLSRHDGDTGLGFGVSPDAPGQPRPQAQLEVVDRDVVEH
jgi:hypothetical protein